MNRVLVTIKIITKTK